MSRKDLEPGDITAIADTREQAPLDLLLKTEVATLFCADYSVKGLENLIAIERKSLPDLIGCVGRDRERFEKCIQRMKGFETRILVVETSWGAIDMKTWRGEITPPQVKAALYSWMGSISVVIAGDRTNAAAIVSGILFSAARQNFRRLKAFYPELRIESDADRAKKAKSNA